MGLQSLISQQAERHGHIWNKSSQKKKKKRQFFLFHPPVPLPRRCYPSTQPQPRATFLREGPGTQEGLQSPCWAQAAPPEQLQQLRAANVTEEQPQVTARGGPGGGFPLQTLQRSPRALPSLPQHGEYKEGKQINVCRAAAAPGGPRGDESGSPWGQPHTMVQGSTHRGPAPHTHGDSGATAWARGQREPTARAVPGSTSLTSQRWL